MKYLYVLAFVVSLVLTGCKREDLNNELEKSIIEYQKKVPFPTLEGNNNNLKKYVFIYVMDISLKDKDTIVNIVRRPSGIPKDSNCYGVYEINELPVVIYDDDNLGGTFIKNKVRNTLLKKYELAENRLHFVDYPPVYSYIIKKDKINLKSVDTTSNNWIK